MKIKVQGDICINIGDDCSYIEFFVIDEHTENIMVFDERVILTHQAIDETLKLKAVVKLSEDKILLTDICDFEYDKFARSVYVDLPDDTEVIVSYFHKIPILLN